MNKLAIFFDIDGTLLDYETKKVPDSTIETLEYLSQFDNVDLFIATGRAKYALNEVKPLLKYFKGFVLNNGCEIIYQDKTIFQQIVDEQIISPLISRIYKDEKAFGLITTNGIIMSYPDPELRDNFFKNIKYEYTDYTVDTPLNNLIELWILDTAEYINSLKPEFPDLTFYNWGSHGADVISNHCNKGLGVRKVIELCGYDINNCFCFGDAKNDVSMFKEVGCSIAMGNAREDVAEHARFVTSKSGEDGIKNGCIKHIYPLLNK